ncbi:MAG: hypothetical protein U1E56_02130 [Bauldia sp.]
MSRYSENYALIDWGEGPPGSSRKTERGQKPAAKAAFFMPDIAPFVSPIDCSEITSRSKLREHERRYGVRQCGELKRLEDWDQRVYRPYEPILPKLMDKYGPRR